MSITHHESLLLLASAVVEVADGQPGPGLAYARDLVALADAGLLTDPSALRDPVPARKPPNSGDALTNADLDPPRQQMGRPTLGQRIRGKA